VTAMGETGSALRRMLEQEKSDLERIRLARDEGASIIESARNRSALLLSQAHLEAQRIADDAKAQSNRECDASRREHLANRDLAIQRLSARYEEIGADLAQIIARRLTGYEG